MTSLPARAVCIHVQASQPVDTGNLRNHANGMFTHAEQAVRPPRQGRPWNETGRGRTRWAMFSFPVGVGRVVGVP
eukprot:51274-Eustigmatos_ZCMA.PRE.1